MITFSEATEEERKIYYTQQWDPKNVPKFITSTIETREFAFDHEGLGPNDRYNQFLTVDSLSEYLKRSAPYAAYSSVSFYEIPKKREKWMGAELVFDVDAKDLPIKSCTCEGVTICEKCLSDAKEVALSVWDILKDDFSLSNIHMIYSGRGYHLRVQDKEVYEIKDRSYILDYILAVHKKEYAKTISDLFTMYGYEKVFRNRLKYFLKNVTERLLKKEGLRSDTIQKIISNKSSAIKSLEENNAEEFQKSLGVGPKTFETVIDINARINARLVDARVTIDVKRILRLPTSLHSKVSMICTYVASPEQFDPLKDAIPTFKLE